MSKREVSETNGDKAGATAPAKRTRRSADETRGDILSRADELFRERGFSAVSMADIAGSLSMSPANVFKHFRTKIDLVDEIVQRLVNKVARDVKILDSSHCPRERIHHLVHALMENHYADFKRNPYIFELLLLTSERDLQCGVHYRAVISNLMSQILSDAKEQKLYFLDDPRSAAATVLNVFTGVLHPVVFTTTDIDELRLSCDEVVSLVDRAFKNALVK